MKHRLFCILALASACSQGEHDYDRGEGDDREEYALPVRVVTPERAAVESTVDTQATLESDKFAQVVAEIDGQVLERLCDIGDTVGGAENGEDAKDTFLLARLDDRDLALALREAEAAILEKQGRIKELELEKQRAQRELDQAHVTEDEAVAALKRTTTGIRDGTISKEEHEKATFARDLAISKVAGADAALKKADVALELGTVAVDQADLARQRAKLKLDRSALRSPIPGVVTQCEVQQGELVKAGTLLFRIEDPSALVVYAKLPVRQARRVKLRNKVHIVSTALDDATIGEVVRIAPTVDPTSGTVRVKIKVDGAAGYKPGLYVGIRIVIETRKEARTVPKRAVLHDDQDGAFLFIVADGAAKRVLVKTGYEKDGRIEIVEGIAEGAQIVVEGQDTLTDGAKIDVLTPAKN
ncbi:MAG: efflux RND transporter periplasmic adaptor subunit [Planctomycetota bacterium]|nr:efflux RND transporter periplasmic adaptor subunit [Planctomycetota bacterium]